MSIARRSRLVVLGAAIAAFAPTARAAPPAAGSGETAADPSAAAEDLFRRALQLMADKQHAEACPLLAESYRLDPAGGTLQNLAVCYETLGRWASAYARFEELRSISRNANPPRMDRVKLAEQHIAQLAPRIARVVVTIPDAAAADAVVKIDGIAYQRASYTAGIALDPGEHDLVVEAHGKQPWATRVTVPSQGGERTVTVPTLADEPKPDAPRPTTGDEERAAAERAAAERAAAERAARERALAKNQSARTTGYVVGGVGLAVLAAGAVFGVLTISKNEDGKAECRAGSPPSDFAPNGRCYEGSDAWRRANDMKDTAEVYANVANVLVPLGLVTGAVGAWLVLSHRSPSPSAASRLRIGPSLGGGMVGGSF